MHVPEGHGIPLPCPVQRPEGEPFRLIRGIFAVPDHHCPGVPASAIDRQPEGRSGPLAGT